MGSGPLGVDEWNGGFSLLWFRVSRREKRYAVGAEESLLRQISTPRKVAIASPIGRGYAGRHVGTARARIRIRQVATVMLIACMITPIFNLLTSEASLRLSSAPPCAPAGDRCHAMRRPGGQGHSGP